MASHPKELIIAVDIGTSAARAVLFDLSAKPLKVVRKPYALSMPQPDWSEQDPEEIVSAVAMSLKDISAYIGAGNKVLCVTFSSQMYSVLALDHSGRPVTNSITWNDRRSARMADQLRARADFRAIVSQTGCPISEIFPLYKILWLKLNLDGHSKLKFVSIKDYVIYRLTGELVSDWSIASASGLFDVVKKQWHEDVLTFAGLKRDINVPELASVRHIIRNWKSSIGDLDLPKGTPMVLGAGDGPLASLGIGAIRHGSVAVNVGTSAAFRMTVNNPALDAGGRLWTFVADEDLWVTGGITGGGLVYDWLLSTYFQNPEAKPQETYARVDELVQSVPPGSGGLLFIPYLSGQQSPDWDAKQRGGFVGVGVEHGLAHFSRAVLEGLAFSLYRIAATVGLDFLRSARGIYMTGGLTNSHVWLQLAADVFGCNILATDNTESSARGSMLLALLALGIVKSPDELPTPDLEYKTFSSDGNRHQIYQNVFSQFENALKRLNN
jgi:gluconokinase